MAYLEYTLYAYTSQGKVKDVQIAFEAGGGEVCCNSSFPWEFIFHFGSSPRELCLLHWHTYKCFTKAAALAGKTLLCWFYVCIPLRMLPVALLSLYFSLLHTKRGLA